MTTENAETSAPVEPIIRKRFGEGERPFGSINIGAEMAASMGDDPRPFLSDEQIHEQLRISGMSRERWDAEWDRRLSAPF